MKVTIEDQSEMDCAVVAERLEIMPKDIESSLMAYQGELLNSIDTTEEFNFVLQILNAVFLGVSD